MFEFTIALAVVSDFAGRVDGQLLEFLFNRPRPQDLFPLLDPLQVRLALFVGLG
jgi:hypothetical protein